MNIRKDVYLVLFFFGLVLPGIGVTPFAPAAESRSFFEYSSETWEKRISSLHRKNKLLEVSAYPELRRFAAMQVAEKYRAEITQIWGEPRDEFPMFLDKHSELLENFWLALEPQHDDVPAAMKLLRQIWEFSPVRLKEFPELAIAIAVVWDQPDSAAFEDSGGQHQAVPAPNRATALDNFQYYSSDQLPLGKWIKAFPWEWLCYVVRNKTSAEERRWTIANYSHRIHELEKAYFDIKWTCDEPPPLKDKPYTLMNMKKYGGVCACQADYAASLCRNMGMPAFWAAYWSRFDYAHAWVIRFDVKKLSKGKIYFTIKEEGNYNKAKQFVTWIRCPHTAQEINEAVILHRLDRVGTNLIAYRRTDILMRCFDSLVKTESLTPDQQLALLLKINAISPGCDKAWKTILDILAKEPQFTDDNGSEKERTKAILKLNDKMVREWIRFPNELPKYTETLLANPLIRKQEKTIYGKLLRALDERRRPDLAISVAANYAESLLNRKKFDEATELLTTVVLRYYDVADSTNLAFDKIRTISEQDFTQTPKLSAFYLQLLPNVFNTKSDLPKGYKKEVLELALQTFRKTGNQNHIMAAQKQLTILENEKKEK